MSARRRHIEQSVDHLLQIRRPGTAEPVRWPQKGLNDRPFGIRYVACIAQPASVMLRPSDFSPGHRILVQCRNRTESQPAETTQPFLGQALSLLETLSLNLSDLQRRGWPIGLFLPLPQLLP